MELAEKKRITEKYYNTYHIGIKRTHLEAFSSTEYKIVIGNSSDGNYYNGLVKEMIRRHWILAILLEYAIGQYTRQRSDR